MIEKEKISLTKMLLLGIGVLIIIGFIVSLGNNKDVKVPENIQDNNPQTETKIAEPEIIESNWAYSEDEDKMTGIKRFFATTTSTNEIEFEFPYDGGSTFHLTLRNMGKGNELLMSVSKGQFMTSIMESEKVRIKFDDENPLNISYNSAEDASSDIIFFNLTNKLVKRLKTAKKLMIEAPFYDSGRQIIYFNVDGLDWDK